MKSSDNEERTKLRKKVDDFENEIQHLSKFI